MPNLIFYLNTGAINKENNTAPLMAKVIHQGKRHYKTIARIKPPTKDSEGDVTQKGDWNEKKKQVYKSNPKSTYNRYVEINATLNQLQKLMTGFNDYCLINEYQVTHEAIKQILNGIDPISGMKSANRPEIDFNQAFETWINHTKENNEFNTYKVRNTVYNFVKDFQQEKKVRITFRNINMLLFDQLKDYAMKEKKYANNTFAKTIKIFKTFLKWCKSREYFTGDIPKDFTAVEKDITPVILTFEEFKTLFNFEFKKEKHKRVRDIFCFGCVTGLRYSDLNQLRREHIQGNDIVVTMKKVKEVVKIPLNQYSKEIIERYQEQPIYVLPRMSNQKLNDYIEEICEEAKINARVVIDIHKGNKFTQETKLKYEVVTAHTARKTFISLSIFLGMNHKVVQEITGIRNERTLRKYIKIVDEMKDAEMKKTWG